MNATMDKLPPSEEIPLEAYSDEPRINGHASATAAVTPQDFYAYMPQHAYIYVPTRELWPAASVNSRIPPISVGLKKAISATAWLDNNRAVEQMSWHPALPMVVEDKLVADGGWIDRSGARTFNLYRSPPQLKGNAAAVGPWITHARRVFQQDAEHIIRWLAHRVQRPGEKINHALVFGGGEGIGKDTLLEPVKAAVGAWNMQEVSPQQLLGRFNGFVKSVILRTSEARDLGDVDRYGLHDHLKTLIAAPPDVLRCDEKNLREYSVFNVTGVIVTTNHVDGLYIPADSRRYFVAWSDATKEEFGQDYWDELYRWYEDGGRGHVAAYLASLDLSSFNPKAPPPKTDGFHRMVNAGRAPEDAELADALESLSNPVVVTITMLLPLAGDSFREWLTDRRNSRQIPHRMEAVGYIAVRNSADRHDGQWRIGGRRQTVYGRRDATENERLAAASRLAREGR